MNTTIQNREALTLNKEREDALAIAEAGYATINIEDTIKRKIRIEGGSLRIDDASYPLAGRKVFFVGIGKCAVRGGRAIEAVLGEALVGGVALDVFAHPSENTSKIETYIGTHPLPSEPNERASERILEFLSGRKENDLVIMLISGGGSTLLCLPNAPMTCIDESALFATLTAQGAPIQDINIVRKHISRARGGALAVAAYPAEVVSFIVSDVPEDNISFIASGPTVLDASTITDAQNILKRYGIPSTRIVFSETAKDEMYFKRVSNTLFLSGKNALEGMRDEAVRRGYTAHIVDTHFSGEARDIGRTVAEKLHSSAPKTVLLYAGESTVMLGAHVGKGGRNQEVALGALEDVRSNELVIPFASDGHDNSEHAGAIADEITRVHAREKNISAEDHLNTHRSYDFFKNTGDALVTGYTGSNVSDLIIALKN